MAADTSAIQAWVQQLVANRIGIMQSSMSADLRAEFEETKTRMRASLDQLSSATDVAVSAKFAEANARRRTEGDP